MARSVAGIFDTGFPPTAGEPDRLPAAQAARRIILASIACWAIIIPAVTMLT